MVSININRKYVWMLIFLAAVSTWGRHSHPFLHLNDMSFQIFNQAPSFTSSAHCNMCHQNIMHRRSSCGKISINQGLAGNKSLGLLNININTHWKETQKGNHSLKGEWQTCFTKDHLTWGTSYKNGPCPNYFIPRW